MKFGQTLRENVLKEWRYYAIDYAALKESIKTGDQSAFLKLLEKQKNDLAQFYQDKEAFHAGYIDTLEGRVQKLLVSSSRSTLGLEAIKLKALSRRENYQGNENENENENGELDVKGLSVISETEVEDETETETEWEDTPPPAPKPSQNKAKSSENEGEKKSGVRTSFEIEEAGGKMSLKQLYKRVAENEHFQCYIYSMKSLKTFERELELLSKFLELNKIGFRKILKKLDKQTGSKIQSVEYEKCLNEMSWLSGGGLNDLKVKVTKMLDLTIALKPNLPAGWSERKVYTIGCFDLFHRGHINVLASLREFGFFLVVGIHDDASYFKLKKKNTIDNLEVRMNNVKPYCDQIFVIPSTDPLPYISAMVSKYDIDNGLCCYARGDDMLNFPSRPWVESVMPVHFVPRTEACSSSLIRTIYHNKDKSLQDVAAFAKTRSDGKPVDENGDVIKNN